MIYPFFTPFKAIMLGWLLSVITILGYMLLTNSRPSVGVFAAVFILLCVLYWSFALIAHKAFCKDSKVLTVDFWQQIQSEYSKNKNSDFICKSSKSFDNIWQDDTFNLEKRRIIKLAELFISHYYGELNNFWAVTASERKLFVPLLCKSNGEPELY